MNTDKRFSPRELAKMATAVPELTEDTDPNFFPSSGVCLACRSQCVLESGLEPTTFCNLCAQGAVIQLGTEVQRIYDAIEKLPPFLSAPLMETLTLGPDKVAAFMKDAIFAQSKRSPTGRGAKKKR